MFTKLKELFTLLEEKFPYSKMGKKFNGKHFIHLNPNGLIVIGVWSKGQIWETGIDDDKDFDDLPKLVSDIENMIENWKK